MSEAMVIAMDFQIGDGATMCMYSDNQAGTIIEAAPGKVKFQRDKATLLNKVNSGEPDALKFYPGGFFGNTQGKQRYAYEADPEGSIYVFTKRKNGKWVVAGSEMRNGMKLIAGRFEYYDFNF